jgi:exoribonuclease R
MLTRYGKYLQETVIIKNTKKKQISINTLDSLALQQLLKTFAILVNIAVDTFTKKSIHDLIDL